MFSEAEEKEARLHWDFNQCLSVKELNNQLQAGLIGSVEHAQAILEVWENHKRLPQYRD